jgi:uracil-DNA glycosylase
MEPQHNSRLAHLTLPKCWQEILVPPISTQLLRARRYEDNARKAGNMVYPPADSVLRALELTPLEKVRVVILGQDPYHGPGQAHGLSFSVPKGVPLPPSLRNIFKERASDLNLPIPESGDLTPTPRWGGRISRTVSLSP